MDDPERANPGGRSDWLSNIWMYVRSVEDRLIALEARVSKLEQESPSRTKSGRIRFNPKHKKSLDED